MSFDKDTKVRTTNHRGIILELLRIRGDKGVTNSELSHISLCYGKRISELRERGVEINNKHLGGGEYVYMLVHEPDQEIVRPKAFDSLLQGVSDLGGKVDVDELTFLLEELGLQVRWKAGTYKQGVKA